MKKSLKILISSVILVILIISSVLFLININAPKKVLLNNYYSKYNSINKLEVPNIEDFNNLIIVENIPEIETTIEEVYYDTSYYDELDYYNDIQLNPYIGVVYYNGHKETYYSENVLPGYGLNIPGRHVNEYDGTVRDIDEYICVAADPSYIGYGEIVETSLGLGKVYDSGCEYGTIDIYTNW